MEKDFESILKRYTLAIRNQPGAEITIERDLALDVLAQLTTLEANANKPQPKGEI